MLRESVGVFLDIFDKDGVVCGSISNLLFE